MARHAPGCLLKNAHDGPCVSPRPSQTPPAIPGLSGLIIGIDWSSGRDEAVQFEPERALP
jgi:hypothetical protein